MKNKTIYIGPTGSGKSYRALSKAVKNKGTTVIINYSAYKKHYEDQFPELGNFQLKDGRYNFTIEKGKKYFIENPLAYKQETHAAEFAKFLVLGCDYGSLKDDKEALVLFDDGSWSRMPDKWLVLWQLSHIDCGILITVDSISDLLNVHHSNYNEKMLEDIKIYWDIVYCPGMD